MEELFFILKANYFLVIKKYIFYILIKCSLFKKKIGYESGRWNLQQSCGASRWMRMVQLPVSVFGEGSECSCRSCSETPFLFLAWYPV